MVELPEDCGWDMIVLDIDGTLLDRQGIIPEMIYLVRELERKGMVVSLASGRTLPNITPIHQSLGISGFIVGENGGMVWDSGKGHPIKALADGSRPKEAAQWLGTQIEGLNPEGIESNRWRETEWCLTEVQDWEEVRDAIASSEWSDISVVPTGFAVHLTIPGHDKASGLRVAFEQRGIDPSRVIACGDAPNDIPMFDLVGFSVSVSRNYPEVVQAADLVTDAHGKEGSLELLKALCERIGS
tara:strand:+ start:1247 stop:1972 length:726 start_codon:yes stop_codon:yes gene_type:complete